ncbi:MAG: efflux RND transporter periplasmic adaptor subunit [Bacteroidales bacterium]|nr:efflux RND transporter periplasmic adaptor subunit [Bacteroidales bacterium]MCF8389966.1 efflux RND transporter periplasmic adaptor subunit [Bacteroidales bacterium]
MKKRILIPLIVFVVVVLSLIVYSAASGPEANVRLTANVEKDDFEIVVTVTGELQAENSVEIKGPDELRSRNLRMRSAIIQNLIAEGTVVDSGDWIATLDRSEADNILKDILDELEKDQSDYTKTKLDTTIQLRQLRDDLINLSFNMEESKIALEQSQFEPPATIRQAQINLDKATRAYSQARENYSLKAQQAKANMTDVKINLDRQIRTRDEMVNLIEKYDIYAPAPGMVIYKKDWNGSKRTIGSEISTWDLTVATLPDLSTLVSITYVNEIDISKIEAGQSVRIGVDAFPELAFNGIVKSVANIGEQLPNTDAKVFEVVIRLIASDPILRPSMTTSNLIVTSILPDVLYIPLEALYSNDSLSFIYCKNQTKQIVVPGETNENFVVIEHGLEENQQILLNIPDDPENYKYEGIELIEILKERNAAEAKRKADLENSQLELNMKKLQNPDKGTSPANSQRPNRRQTQ